MASPHMAGLAAMVLGVNNTLNPIQVRNILLNGVDDLDNPGFDSHFGYGRINAYKILFSMDTTTPPTARIFKPYNNFVTANKWEYLW